MDSPSSPDSGPTNDDLRGRARINPRRFQLVGALAYLVVGAAILTFRFEISNLLNLQFGFVFAAGALTLFGGLAMVMLLYLRGAVKFRFLDALLTLDESEPVQVAFHPLRTPDFDPEELKRKLRLLEAKLAAASVPGAGTTDAERQALLEQLRDSISPTLVTELRQRFSDELKRSEHLSQAREAFDVSARRLAAEVSALCRRGNLNLVIGVLATISAAVLLYWSVLRATPSLSTMHEVLSYYIPRLATVIFVEVFAFFFLRLYKASLTELQYYQGELTRLALIEITLETAMRTQDNQLIATTLGSISPTYTTNLVPDATSRTSKRSKVDIDLLKQVSDLVKALKG